jgi:hypothetical protein
LFPQDCHGVLNPTSLETRDAPDTVLSGYPANPNDGCPVRAGDRRSGRIAGLTTIFLVKKTKTNKFMKKL